MIKKTVLSVSLFIFLVSFSGCWLSEPIVAKPKSLGIYNSERPIKKLSPQTMAARSDRIIVSSWFFLLVGGGGETRETVRSVPAVKVLVFMWQLTDGTYVKSSLPVNETLRVRFADVDVPTVNFKICPYGESVESVFLNNPSSLNSRNILCYATITVREKDWPAELLL